MPQPASKSALRVAIVGGGITGLAAAHRVRELVPQVELALFEAGPRLGGVLETVHLGDFLVERSADNFLTRLPHAVELCRRLGIENELVSTDESRRRAFVVKSGHLVPIPEGFYLMAPRKLGPILSSDILSIPGKLRLLAEPLVPRGPAAATKGEGSDSTNTADESIASFARRRLGRETFERLVQPLVAGIYTGDPEKLSMAATMPDFLAKERSGGSLLRKSKSDRKDHGETASGARYNLFSTPRGGIGALVQALAAKLPSNGVHLNAPISTARQVEKLRWKIEPSHANSQSDFDALVLAVPAFAAAKIIQNQEPALASELDAIEYAGCAVVCLGYNRSQIGHPLDGFGFVVPHIEKRRIIAASFASNKYPGRAPDNDVLIRVFIGGALQPELLRLSDSELRSLAIDELRDLLQISGEPLVADVSRWPRSMPQYHVGHLGRVATIEAFASRYPTLALAGNAYRGVGIPQCIASGEAAAERIASQFNH